MYRYVATNVIDRNGHIWIKDLFEAMDESNSGKVSKAEIAAFYKKINSGKNKLEVDRIFGNIDTE